MKFLKLWLPVFLWCAVIFFLSGIPQLGTGWGIWDLILRKLAHISEYFILAFLLYRAFKGTFRLSCRGLFFLPFTLTFLYAISDEIHQLFIFGRSGNPLDVVIDTLGIVIFYALIKYNKKFSEKVMFQV